MPRLFAALEIPHEAALSLSLLRGGLPNARWVEPADYHLTLRFYGDVSFAAADEIAAALDRLHCRPFTLALKGVHVFSPKKPHSLYAALEPSKPLAALQEKIENAARRIVPPETRKWRPHVTLARLRQTNEQDLAAYLSGRGNFAAPLWPVKRFCLMSSKDSVGGGPYIIEEAWPLA